MNTQYKSSSFATNLQYILSPVLLVLFLYFFYLSSNTSNLADKIPMSYIPIIVWTSILLVLNLFKLKYLTINDSNILVKTLNGQNIIEFNDIVWINQSNIGSNWYVIFIKYINKETGKSKIIYMLPEMYTSREGVSVLNPFGELNITKYIREQIIKANPSYQKENEPSRWSLIIWVFISLIPFVLISVLFM